MKFNIKSVVCLLIAVVMLLPLTCFAEEGNPFVDEVGRISLPKATPVIDGTIAEGEGWSAPQHTDETNSDGCWGGEEMRVETDIYRAFDEENLYIAAVIYDPEVILSTAKDDIEGSTIGNKPGWNGDVFIYSVDPLGAMLDIGMNVEPAPWYCFGIFEGNVVNTYRTHVNDSDITDLVSAAGATFDGGWKFEAAIPWELICDDVYAISLGDVDLKPEDILKNGNDVSCSMIYYDRFFDPEAEINETYSRYITIANILPDGSYGINCSGWYLQAHGMHFIIEGLPQEQVQQPGTDDKVSDSVTAQGGAQGQEGANTGAVTTGKGGASGSTTKVQSTTNSSGESSAQTGDIGVAIALGALLASGTGLCATCKRRNKK